MIKTGNNPISKAIGWYQEHGPNPLATATLLGIGAGGLTWLAWNPVVDAFKALGHPFARKSAEGHGLKESEAVENWDQSAEELRESSRAKKLAPWLIGALTGGTALMLFSNKNQLNHGLYDWHAPNVAHDEPHVVLSKWQEKRASIDNSGFIQDLDWSKQLRLKESLELFGPAALPSSDYARHMGTAILTNAAMTQGTRSPTLGGVFDSAVDKIETKLSLGGIVSTGVKTVVANGIAKLFTGAVDAVVGLPDNTKNNLISAGTWAGAITSILE